MKPFASNMILLTLLNLCLLTVALPSMQNVEIVGDNNRLKKDESDNSNGNGAQPESRDGSEREVMGRQHTAQSKCGYEVRWWNIIGLYNCPINRIFCYSRVRK